MVAKLSSVRTIVAASLVTSVPVTPIATPMSALRSAGASLTPSPVIATTSPRACSARTMRILCSGDTRATTPISSSRRAEVGVVADPVQVGAGDGLAGDAELSRRSPRRSRRGRR